MRRRRDLALFALLLFGAACKRSPPNSREQATAVGSSTHGSATPPTTHYGAPAGATPESASVLSPSASTAPSASAALPGGASPRSEFVHCKAFGKRGQVQFGTLREALIDLVLERDNIFAFTYHHDLARVSLTRYGRDGSPPELVGRHTSLGEPKSPILTADAGYFLRNKSVFRMPRTGGDTVELAKGFSGAIAVHNGYLYGFECDPKRPPDRLLRVSTSGGNIERLVELERSKTSVQDGSGLPCDYHSVLADDTAIFAANWGSRQILRITLGDWSITPLVTKLAFPSSLAFDADTILFQAANGLYRVSRSEPGATRLSELGSAPFTYVVHADATTYIHQGVPYMPEEWTYELVRATGKPRKIEHYAALDPNETPPDTGIRGLAVDDECLYTARQRKTDFVLLARSRQQ